LPLRKHVARTLVNKGIMLGTLGCAEETIAVYDEVLKHMRLRRFHHCDNPRGNGQLPLECLGYGFGPTPESGPRPMPSIWRG
jgi:hypothetical protein